MTGIKYGCKRVQFGPDEKMKIRDLVVLSDQSSSETQLCVGFRDFDNPLKIVCRNNVYFVHDEYSKIDTRDDIHGTLRNVSSFSFVRHHTVPVIER